MVRPVHGGCWWAIAALVVAPGRQWLDGVIFDITERPVSKRSSVVLLLWGPPPRNASV